MRSNKQTDKEKLTVAFHNTANVPKNNMYKMTTI